MNEFELDVLCSVQYLFSDRRKKTNPKIEDVGIFLRGSDLSRKKAYTHKYDIYSKYPLCKNDDIQCVIDNLIESGFVNYEHGYKVTKKGVAFLQEHYPTALIDPYIQENTELHDNGGYRYIGRYACYYRVSVFKKKTKNEFLDSLEAYYTKTTPYALQKEQINAWVNCYDVLQSTFRMLPSQYGELYVIFEYVLPNHKPGTKRAEDDNGIRADVILVSSKTTVVLEFKQRQDDFEGFVSQANKYRKRLERYHKQAKTMNNKAVLVLTKAKKYQAEHGGIVSCSADNLPHTIAVAFEKEIIRHDNIKEWINSEFE